MIQFKDSGLAGQYMDLVDKCPPLFAVLATAQAWAKLGLAQDIVVTSLYRPDNEDSVHAHWRGVDLRVYNPARNVPDEMAGLWEDDAQELCRYLNGVFDYGRDKVVAIVHGTGLNRHVHIQVPIISAWT